MKTRFLDYSAWLCVEKFKTHVFETKQIQRLINNTKENQQNMLKLRLYRCL